jgi:hypothetical protein
MGRFPANIEAYRRGEALVNCPVLLPEWRASAFTRRRWSNTYLLHIFHFIYSSLSAMLRAFGTESMMGAWHVPYQ